MKYLLSEDEYETLRYGERPAPTNQKINVYNCSSCALNHTAVTFEPAPVEMFKQQTYAARCPNTGKLIFMRDAVSQNRFALHNQTADMKVDGVTLSPGDTVLFTNVGTGFKVSWLDEIFAPLWKRLQSLQTEGQTPGWHGGVKAARMAVLDYFSDLAKDGD